MASVYNAGPVEQGTYAGLDLDPNGSRDMGIPTGQVHNEAT